MLVGMHKQMQLPDDLQKAFAALERRLSAYEPRLGQKRMAAAVAQAFRSERHLFVEAGTGVGKTFAYLLPAALSGRRVVISTATKALQEQLIEKDVPLLLSVCKELGKTVSVAAMKGLSNYVCLRRLSDAMHQNDKILPLLSWVAETQTGDQSELRDPRLLNLWSEVSSSSETRIGSPCKHFERCFVTQMRKRAELSDILIVNHHLFFADLALKSRPEGAFASVIPAYDHVVFDEAHQLESIVTDFFGIELSFAKVEAFLKDSLRELPQSEPFFKLVEGVRVTAAQMFAAFDIAASSKRALTTEDFLHQKAKGHLGRFETGLDAIAARAAAEAGEAAEAIARRCQGIVDSLARIERAANECNHENAWIEDRARSRVLGVSPIEVGGILKANLFAKVPGVVCTSATLSSFGSLDHVRERLGAEDLETDALLVESPFDYPSQALLYVPQDLPEPSHPTFDAQATERILALLRLSKGGAFVLCTSIRAMKQFHGQLLRGFPGLVLEQGQGSKQALLDQFRNHGHAVLVATMSFWEGVDVPGAALRLVILDKIPFPVPTDPLHQQRAQRLEANGRNAFVELSVVEAAMKLKQGFGRLIRTQSDRGVVTVLDGRLVQKRYGKKLLEELPRAKLTHAIDDVEAFFESGATPDPHD
jgi:ATP-dependent DNA helicase DinG